MYGELQQLCQSSESSVSSSVSGRLTCPIDGEYQWQQRNRIQLQREQHFINHHRHGIHGDVPLDAAQFAVTSTAVLYEDVKL